MLRWQEEEEEVEDEPSPEKHKFRISIYMCLLPNARTPLWHQDFATERMARVMWDDVCASGDPFMRGVNGDWGSPVIRSKMDDFYRSHSEDGEGDWDCTDKAVDYVLQKVSDVNGDEEVITTTRKPVAPFYTPPEISDDEEEVTDDEEVVPDDEPSPENPEDEEEVQDVEPPPENTEKSPLLRLVVTGFPADGRHQSLRTVFSQDSVAPNANGRPHWSMEEGGHLYYSTTGKWKKKRRR